MGKIDVQTRRITRQLIDDGLAVPRVDELTE
jgi:hypothetical protein